MPKTKSTPAVSPKRRVISLPEYLTTVAETLETWVDEEGTDFSPWFRGHHQSSWRLQPTVYRSEFTNLSEDDCRQDFKLRAYPYLVNTARDPVDDWEWYFVMQHHGLPTRLLDWTESPLVALYFALREATGNFDAAVWMLDPWWLNEHTGGFDNEILWSNDPRVLNYLPVPFARGVVIPDKPIAIEAPYTSRRIAAQRGAFTLHGSARKPLEKHPELAKRLVKIIVPRGNINNMKNALRSAGIRETLVFPELPGLCRELLDHWLH
jgi:hypothetical protein